MNSINFNGKFTIPYMEIPKSIRKEQCLANELGKQITFLNTEGTDEGIQDTIPDYQDKLYLAILSKYGVKKVIVHL